MSPMAPERSSARFPMHRAAGAIALAVCVLLPAWSLASGLNGDGRAAPLDDQEQWSWLLYQSLGWDNNPTQSSEDRTRLGQGGSGSGSDRVLLTLVQAEVRNRTAPWTGEWTVLRNDYERFDAFDLMALDLGAGCEGALPDAGRAAIQAKAGNSWLDGARFETGGEVSVQWTGRPLPDHEARLTVGQRWTDHPGAYSGLDGRGREARLRLDRDLEGAWRRLRIKLAWARDTTRIRHLGSGSGELDVSAERPLAGPAGPVLELFASYRARRYASVHPDFGRRRRDSRWRLGAGLSQAFGEHVVAGVQAQHSDNGSTIPSRYEYRQTFVEVYLTVVF